MTSDDNREKARKHLYQIDVHGRGLSKWELDFIEDLQDKFDTYGDNTLITDNVLDILERIEEERT
jgi:hypothetical protein